MMILAEADEIPPDLLHYFEPVNNEKPDVWQIATHPLKEAHFATFPPALVEPCIKAGTSEKGCCPECGKAWMRMMERGSNPANEELIASRSDRGRTRTTDNLTSGPEWRAYKVKHPDKFIGWQPSCSCGADVDSGALDPNTGAGIDVCQPHDPVPSVVLDPFSGAGTTLLVADRMGRDAIGIELSPEYAEMSRRRIADESPMFADVEMVS